MSGTQHVPSRDRPRFRAPHRRGTRVVVAVTALGLLAAPIAREAAASGAAAEATNSVSAEPSVVIDGGTAEQRQTVFNAVDRYLSVGLALPADQWASPELDEDVWTGFEPLNLGGMRISTGIRILF